MTHRIINRGGAKKAMHVLVLGGTRFVGLHTVHALLCQGHSVTTLNRGRFPQPPGVKHLKCDRKQPSQLETVLDKQEFDAAIDISAEDPEDTVAIVKLLEGKVDRFVHCSTGAVYEDRWEYPVLEQDPTTEWAGNRTYPENKAQCERLLFQAHENRDFPINILRPTVIYGPHNYAYREAYVFDRAEAQRPVPVPGDGKSVTHVVHVDDVAQAFTASLTSKHAIGQAYNIAGPRAVTLDKWVDAAAQPITRQPRKVYYDEKELARVKGSFPLPASPWIMSIEKARRDLGFQPRDLSTGMRETYEWYSKTHPFGPPDFQFDKLAKASHKTHRE